jgi:cytochrome c-type biogenesis protein
MKEFFVEQIFSGVLVAAFPFAFIAGVISFLSPCVFAISTRLSFICSGTFP